MIEVIYDQATTGNGNRYTGIISIDPQKPFNYLRYNTAVIDCFKSYWSKRRFPINDENGYSKLGKTKGGVH